nr:hypothetical protein CFP56_69218 [Quercus suber]
MLFLRKVLTDNRCDECGSATESTGHLFWSFPRAQLVWSCSKLPSSLRSGQFHSFFDLLCFLLMIEAFEEEKVALVVTIAWSLWSNRNSVRHRGLRKTPEAIVQWASHYLCSAGIGVVIRDEAGRIVAAMGKQCHVPLGPLEVEAKAFETGLQLAWDLGLQNVILEGDSLVMVRALCGQSVPPSSVDSLCLGIQMISSKFHSVNVSHVRR